MGECLWAWGESGGEDEGKDGRAGVGLGGMEGRGGEVEGQGQRRGLGSEAKVFT